MIAAIKSIFTTTLHVVQGTMNALDEGITYAEEAITASSIHERAKLRKQFIKDMEEIKALGLADISPIRDNPFKN